MAPPCGGLSTNKKTAGDGGWEKCERGEIRTLSQWLERLLLTNPQSESSGKTLEDEYREAEESGLPNRHEDFSIISSEEVESKRLPLEFVPYREGI